MDISILEEQIEALKTQKKQAEALFLKCDGAIESLETAIKNLSEKKDSNKKTK